MDMQLVPKYADEATDEGQVAISPRVMQNLGVRTAEARTGSLTERVEVLLDIQLRFAHDRVPPTHHEVVNPGRHSGNAG